MASFATNHFEDLGRQVAVLADEQRAAGTHTIGWEAAGVASGVYLYRLQAGDFTASQRMVVVK